MAAKRICIIGAGPSGMATLFHFAKLENMPDVVVYEKQTTWGGLWNTSWRTGLDEYDEPNHASMYKHLWTNGSKEMNEFPDYTYHEHFGQLTPSFAPRVVFKDYLEGRWTKKADRELKPFIEFNTVVRRVKYNDDNDYYTVTVNNLKTKETREEIFSHVIVATGIYSTPFVPDVPGMNDFNGRILHCHDLRNASEFKGQDVLVMGASFSGEDVALQLVKFGAKNVYLSYKRIPKSATCLLPKEIEERPLVVKIDANEAYFSDGTNVEIDSVILCTGYKNHFPFLEDRFRILEQTHFYPPGLYMGALFYKEGKNNFFYVGVQNQLFTFQYFDAVAIWTCRYIMGQLPGKPKSQKEMKADADSWVKRAEANVSEFDVLNFQSDLIDTLVEQSGYEHDLAKSKVLFAKLLQIRREVGLVKYRDISYTSVYTGKTGLKQAPYMENFDDSLEAFLNVK